MRIENRLMPLRGHAMYEKSFIQSLNDLNQSFEDILASSIIMDNGVVIAIARNEGAMESLNIDRLGFLSMAMMNIIGMPSATELVGDETEWIVLKFQSAWMIIMKINEDLFINVLVKSGSDIELISNGMKNILCFHAAASAEEIANSCHALCQSWAS
jgi:predicted regulator of Ras-like GTPase activity (Roadblock/LC7/MglB family)